MVEQAISPASQAELINLAYAAMLVRDMHSRVIFWNREAERTYGWSKDEALGRLSHELLHTRFPIPLEQIEAQVLETGYWQGEIVHVTRDGRELSLLSRWALQSDAARRARIDP